jgi:hypothetical protein
MIPRSDIQSRTRMKPGESSPVQATPANRSDVYDNRPATGAEIHST